MPVRKKPGGSKLGDGDRDGIREVPSSVKTTARKGRSPPTKRVKITNVDVLGKAIPHSRGFSCGGPLDGQPPAEDSASPFPWTSEYTKATETVSPKDLPSIIDMVTGRAVPWPGADWVAKDAAKRAVLGLDTEARLIGSVTVHVHMRSAIFRAMLSAQKVKSTQRPVKGLKGPIQVNWDRTSGEFPTPQGQLPLSRLLCAMDEKKALCAEESHASIMERLWSLQNPQSSPWRRPMIRLLTSLQPPPAILLAPDEPEEEEADLNVEVTFHVYFGRLIFELIANSDTQALMAALTPAGDVFSAARLPPSTGRFRRSPSGAPRPSSNATAGATSSNGVVDVVEESEGEGRVKERRSEVGGEEASVGGVLEPGGGDHGPEQEATSVPGATEGLSATPWERARRDFQFSLPGLLHAAESTGYAVRDPQPRGLTVSMFEFQRSTLQWMLDRERGPSLNEYFWERRAWKDAETAEECFYYFPDAGELRLEKPPHRTGGVLCEEMGLGKTVECLALILANPLAAEGGGSDERGASGDEEKGDSPWPGGGDAVPATTGDLGGQKGRRRSGGGSNGSRLAQGTGGAGAEGWKEDGLEEEDLTGRPSRATLIVVPGTLLNQWMMEVRKTTEAGALEALVFRGNVKVTKSLRELRRITREGWVGSFIPSAAELPVGELVWAPVCLTPDRENQGSARRGTAGPASSSPSHPPASLRDPDRRRLRESYHRAKVLKVMEGPLGATVELRYWYERNEVWDADLVITTYDVLRNANGGPMLRHVHWHRVILDECQEIRTSTSAIARLCSVLHATHRWMVSGTPLFASVDDLFGELQFLAVSPFSLANDGFWEAKVGGPWRRREESALRLLHLLVSVCMMRHSKGQTYACNGSPLVAMPTRTITWQPVEGSSVSEQFCYAYLEVLAAKECIRLVEQTLTAATFQATSAEGEGERGAGGEREGGGGAREDDQHRRSGRGRGGRRRGGRGRAGGDGGGIAARGDPPGGGRGRGGVAAPPPRTPRVLTREEQRRVLSRAMERAHGGRRHAAAGAHAKLKALLFMLQRVLLHPSLVPLHQLDTIKRSLQIQQRLVAIAADAGPAGAIPVLGIEDMLARLQGRNAAGGLTRDVNRTWALHGDELVEARDKLETLSLQQLRARMEAEGLPLPIAWVQLPLRAAAARGSRSVSVRVHYEDEEGGKGGEGGGVASPAQGDVEEKEIIGARDADVGRAGGAAKGRQNKAVDELVVPGDVLRIGLNDEDFEARVEAVDVAAGGSRGEVRLEGAWACEDQRKALVFKRGPATRKKAYADLLLAKEKEQKGMTDQLHEAGFASIFAVLEGGDLSCPICLCTVSEPTVTQCCHVYCQSCILAQIEEAQKQHELHGGYGGLANLVTRCAVCRKPISQKSLMRLETSSIERYEAAAEEVDGKVAAGVTRAGAVSNAADAESGPGGGGKGNAGESMDVKMPPALPRNRSGDGDDAADGRGETKAVDAHPAEHGGRASRQCRSAAAPSPSSPSRGSAIHTVMNIPQVGCPPAADEATLQRLPVPFACGRDNSLPSLEPAFLAHYRNTSMVPSAKMRALVGILESTLSSDPSAKFVVFSQFPFTTVKPCLDQHGFACVSVTAQCKMADRQQAVGAFSSDPDVKVILVGMGVGAAGLTLTAASTLILLEPSHNLGDEAQAMSRIHRIGQAASSVEIFVLFTPRTVEERMLKVRQDQGHAFMQGGDDSAALSVTSGGDKGSHFSLASFQAFLGLGEAVDEED